MTNAQRVGGCTFHCDPDEESARARPIWSAAVDPRVLRVQALPSTNDRPLTFDTKKFDCRIALGRDGEYLLLCGFGEPLRLDAVSGTFRAGPVRLEPIISLERFRFQIAEVRKLCALLRNAAPPVEHEPRLERLVLALRAHDGLVQGASLRNLATGLFGTDDWPGDGDNVKSRVRRLVAMARTLREVGPPGVLAGRPGPVASSSLRNITPSR